MEALTATQRLTQTVEDFCAYMQAVAAGSSADRRKAGEWNGHEVLAHLVYHHENYVSQVEAVIAGRPAPLPKGTFKSLNALAVAQLGAAPIPDLVQRLRLANQRLCTLVEQHNLGQTELPLKQGSKAWKLDDLLPAVASHIRNHQKALRK